jgi:hypothetical protein
MDLFASMPEWLAWFAAAAVAILALATLANVLQAALDLEAG